MAVEIIEGVLEPVQPSRRKRGYGRYDELRITVPNGQVRKLGKVAAGGAVLDEVGRGGPGLYYVATADGALALIGVRRADGTATYPHYTNMEPILLVVGLLGTAAAVARFGFGAEVPLLACVLGPLLLVGWFYLRSQRLAQRQAFDEG